MYLNELYEEETRIFAAGGRFAEAEEVSRRRVQGTEEIREISRPRWPEGEYSQVAR